MSDDLWEWRWRNWLRWCRDNQLHRGRCLSAEGVWYGPQGAGCPTGWGDYHESALPDRPDPVDLVEALLLNRAFISMEDGIRRTIKLLFFSPHRDSKVARRLKCRVVDLPMKAIWAKTCLRNRLQFILSKRRIKRVTDPAGNGYSALRGAFAFEKGCCAQGASR